MDIPVIAFAAYSGTGKTTLIEKLIIALRAKGLRLAVIKHDGHSFEIDHEGKDSWRFMQAGADMTIISSAEKTACIDRRGSMLEQLLGMVHDVDLIFVEGYKNENLPQIGIARKETGKGFTADISRYIAVITDMEVTTGVPCFGLDDIAGITQFIMEKVLVKQEKDFTHFNENGRAQMVDVGEKPVSRRIAVAAGRVLVNEATFARIKTGGMKKGDVLAVAQVAGIMGAKHTPDIIPMCHPIMIDGIDLELVLDESRCSVEITATVSCDGRTGVEMEALTAVSAAALTVYDMCKAVQKDMVITDIRLLEKSGGVHGDYKREESVCAIQQQ